MRERTLQTYIQGADHALTKGIIVADTKFEFGVDKDGNLRLADEVFTPDSSGTGVPTTGRRVSSKTASTSSSSATG